MSNKAKKYFNIIRNNEDLSLGGLRTLKMIEDEFDNLHLQVIALSKYKTIDSLDDENSELSKIGCDIADMTDEEFEKNLKEFEKLINK